MPIELTKEAQAIVEAAVASGSYATADAAVDAAIGLLAEREQKLAWLRDKIKRSIDDGGSYSDQEVGDYLDSLLEETEHPQAAR